MKSDNSFQPVWYMTGKNGMEIAYLDRDERQTYPQICAFFNFPGSKLEFPRGKQNGVTAEMWGTAKDGNPALRISPSGYPEQGEWQTAVSVVGYWRFSSGAWNLHKFTEAESDALTEVLSVHIRGGESETELHEWLAQRCVRQMFHAMRSLGFPASAKDFVSHTAAAVRRSPRAASATAKPKPKPEAKTETKKPKQTKRQPAKPAAKPAPKTRKTSKAAPAKRSKTITAPKLSVPENADPPPAELAPVAELEETIESPPIFQPMK